MAVVPWISSDEEPELLEQWVSSQRGVYQAGPLFLRHIFDGSTKSQLRTYFEGLPCYYMNTMRTGTCRAAGLACWLWPIVTSRWS